MRAAVGLGLVAALLFGGIAGCAPRPQPAGNTTIGPTAPPPKQAVEASLPPIPPPSEFVAEVTNPWYPLRPGSKWVAAGVKDGKAMTDTVTVTDRKKTIIGVRTTVVRDTTMQDGRIVEDTEDWFAQDRSGNVWYFGEDTKTFRPDGSLESTEGSWETGVDGARGGIFMPASPASGQAFWNERAPGVAEDWFKIVSTDASTTVPFGTFSGCVQTEERTPLEPDVVGQKFYARDVGLVFENDVTGPTEYFKLVSYTQDASAEGDYSE